MSENLDLVRAIYAAWERGDFSSTEWAHPEIEFVFVGGPEPGKVIGVAGMAERYSDWLNAWEDFRVLADDYRELVDGRIFVFVHNGGRGKASGLEIGQVMGKGANLLLLRDGKVIRFVVYFDRDTALADLGLDPETG